MGGWLRSVGSMKLKVSFAEYHLFYRALLQKRLIIWSILLTEATPYSCAYGVVLSHVWRGHVTHVNEWCHTQHESALSHMWMRDMTHSYVWHGHVTHSHLWHDTLTQMSTVSVSHVTRLSESCHTHAWVMSHIWVSHVTRVNKFCHTYECVMQWGGYD